MNNSINRARMFITREDGPTATEYAVILALIIAVVLTAITTMGHHVRATFRLLAHAIRK